MAAFAGRLAIVVLVLLLGTAHGARAQGGTQLTATGTQDLNFGTIFPGVPEQVLRTDAANAGRFDVRGHPRAEVRITVTLPAALTASGGRTIPLVFGPNDGGSSNLNNALIATAFDPRVPLITTLGTPGRLFVFLGGTLTPGPTATAGTYQATITLTSAYTGN
jgi:hypothetical protein